MDDREPSKWAVEAATGLCAPGADSDTVVELARQIESYVAGNV